MARQNLVEGVLFVADVPDQAGNILSAEALRKMADGNAELIFDETARALIYRGPMPNGSP